MNTATAENKIMYTVNAQNFSKIPGSPIAYWVSRQISDSFVKFPTVSKWGTPRQGLASGDNGRYLRYWFEVEFNSFGVGLHSVEDFDKKEKLYAPHNKGGEFRKWYGNLDFVIRFSKTSRANLSLMGNHLPSRDYYFMTGFTWTDLTTGMFGARFIDCGAVFDTSGPTFFEYGRDTVNIKYILGYFNSNTFNMIAKILCSGLHYSNGVIAELPCEINAASKNHVIYLVDENIAFSQSDWDSFETSWDFKKHPLI